MNAKFRALYSLKFHPFHPDVPTEALCATPAVDAFLRRVELTLADGGFAMLTGDPGSGKTIATRLLADRLRALPNVVVGTIEHPQSRTSDFYRELGDLFGIPLTIHNRWAGFKASASTHRRPGELTRRSARWRCEWSHRRKSEAVRSVRRPGCASYATCSTYTMSSGQPLWATNAATLACWRSSPA